MSRSVCDKDVKCDIVGVSNEMHERTATMDVIRVKCPMGREVNLLFFADDIVLAEKLNEFLRSVRRENRR